MVLVREVKQSEYAKIRKHVLGLIFKSGPTPMRLGSSREIAKEFGVTHTTVARAMKDLVADGFVVIKTGVGAFTQPSKQAERGFRSVGLFFGDGKIVFLGRINLQLGLVGADSVLERDGNCHIQQCFLTAPLATADQEIMKMGLDGVLWVLPTQSSFPAIERLKASGMPVVAITLGCHPAGVSRFTIDFEGDSYRVAQMMLAEGRRKLLPLLPCEATLQEKVLAGLARAHAEAGLSFDRSFSVVHRVEEPELLKRLLPILKPDGIVAGPAVAASARAAGLDIVDDCRLYTHCFNLSGDLDYVGYVGEPQRSPALAENLLAQMENPGAAPVVEAFINMKIYMTGK